jgi:hypothetical protein
MLFGLLAHAAATFDLSADFSFQNSPNRFGSTTTPPLTPLIRASSESTSMLTRRARLASGTRVSASSLHQGVWYPYVAYNSANQSRMGSNNGWAVRPGEVAMEASSSGQYSLIRFVVPVAGTYKITAQFEGIQFGLSSADVHILHNGASLFDADIDGYGGDPAFHEIKGSSPTATFSGQVKLKANDAVTFAAGYGKNKRNFCDTTVSLPMFYCSLTLAGDKYSNRLSSSAQN